MFYYVNVILNMTCYMERELIFVIFKLLKEFVKLI